MCRGLPKTLCVQHVGAVVRHRHRMVGWDCANRFDAAKSTYRNAFVMRFDSLTAALAVTIPEKIRLPCPPLLRPNEEGQEMMYKGIRSSHNLVRPALCVWVGC